VTTVRFLLDTNVAIGLLQGSGPARHLVESSLALPSLCDVSQITRMELLSFPALQPAEERVILAFLAGVTVIPLDDRIERQAMNLRRRTRLRLPDASIAATAQVRGLRLLTLDKSILAAVSP
jgi:predicted nucleic acid-binding protein